MKPNTFLAVRRKTLCSSVFLFFPLVACGGPPSSVTLDVVSFNYLDRPIFDIFVDGQGGHGSDAYPATGGGTISGVRFRTGPKAISWRLDGPEGTPRNGDKVVARNTPTLKDVPKEARYLAVHVYPDETVELAVTRHYPRATTKGIALAGKHGKGG